METTKIMELTHAKMITLTVEMDAQMFANSRQDGNVMVEHPHKKTPVLRSAEMASEFSKYVMILTLIMTMVVQMHVSKKMATIVQEHLEPTETLVLKSAVTPS